MDVKLINKDFILFIKMATLRDIIINNCPMVNIETWACKQIRERLRQIHDSIVALKTLGPVPVKRLICHLLEEDINDMLTIICGLEDELANDDIVTPEFEDFIIEYLTDLTSNEPFREYTRTTGEFGMYPSLDKYNG